MYDNRFLDFRFVWIRIGPQIRHYTADAEQQTLDAPFDSWRPSVRKEILSNTYVENLVLYIYMYLYLQIKEKIRLYNLSKIHNINIMYFFYTMILLKTMSCPEKKNK